jgi:glycine cleavage system H protein
MREFIETTIDKFVFRTAVDCLYSPEGIWVRLVQSRVQVGITDFQQQRNGDLAFAAFKPPGTILVIGDEMAEVETVKANVSLFSPIAGKVVDVNPALATTPEIINQDPYGKGWLAVLEPMHWEADRVKLLDPQTYVSLMQSQAQEDLDPLGPEKE